MGGDSGNDAGNGPAAFGFGNRRTRQGQRVGTANIEGGEGLGKKKTTAKVPKQGSKPDPKKPGTEGTTGLGAAKKAPIRRKTIIVESDDDFDLAFTTGKTLLGS